MAEVSIIIPVYNVEKFLARCLETVIIQTFKDIEIICVNDGTTDCSLKILEQYAKLDNRIKIINKENGGLSSARNAGVREATGKYLLFVDSDDWISSVTVEKLYNNAEKNNADVVVFNYLMGDSQLKDVRPIVIMEYKDMYKDNPFNIDNMSELSYKEIPVTTWCKFYRTDLVKDNILFYEDMIYEDVPFWADVYVRAKRITYLPEFLYYYRTGRSDQITSFSDKRIFDIIKGYQRVQTTLEHFNYWEKYKHAVQLLMMMDLMMKLRMIEPQYRQELFNTYKSLPVEIDFDYYKTQKLLSFEEAGVMLYKKLLDLSYDEFMEELKKVYNVRA